MLSNAFLTYELLINIRHKERGNGMEEDKERTYHAFSILGKDGGEFVEATANFDKNFENVLKVTQSIIEINANLYGNYTKIIIEQAPVPPPNPNLAANNPNPPNPNGPPQRPPQAVPNEARNPRDLHRPGGPPPPPTAPTGHPAPQSQAFNINPNTFIDD